MTIKGALAAAAVLFVGFFSAAEAVPITYTISGTGNLTVGGALYADTAFTWTIGSDTSAVTPGTPYTFAPAFTDTITVAGAGTLITDISAFAVQPGSGVAAFFVTALGSGVTFSAPGLLGYDAQHSIGPMLADVLVNTGVHTDHGIFYFDSPSVTFQASGVPEPFTLALFGAGLAGLGLMRRRRICT